MPLHIIEKDITKIAVDAIVNSTNSQLIGWSGVDKIIHDLGGDELEAECDAKRNSCMPGEAIWTHAYNLASKYIIHTVGTLWQDGYEGEIAIQRSCYHQALAVAEELGCNSVAFPLINAGSMGCPIAVALASAVQPIREYLQLYSDMDVYLCLYGGSAMAMAESMFDGLDDYIAANIEPASPDLDEMLSNQGEGFVDMLYHFMDAKGIDKASQLYKKAGISKATYSKLISGGSKKPSLETAVGLAMALELTYDETLEFLASAGMTLSNSSEYDIIVSYFIKSGNYDIWELDVQLYNHGFKTLLGA